MSNSDLGRLLKSDEIQNAVRPPQKLKARDRHVLKKNPLKNSAIMTRLNPYADVQYRNAYLQNERNAHNRQVAIAKRRGVCIVLMSVFQITQFCNFSAHNLICAPVHDDIWSVLLN